MRRFHVYILSNRTGTIYTGVTSNLPHRLEQHRAGTADAFTKKYMIDRLVYAEEAPDAQSAIAREKQIKRWRREKKVALIKSINPHWRDLSQELI